MAKAESLQQCLDQMNGTVSEDWQAAHSEKLEATDRERVQYENLKKILDKSNRAVKKYIESKAGHNVDCEGDAFLISFDQRDAKDGKLCINASWVVRKFIYSNGSRHRVEVVCRIQPKSIEQIDRAISDFNAACQAISDNAG